MIKLILKIVLQTLIYCCNIKISLNIDIVLDINVVLQVIISLVRILLLYYKYYTSKKKSKINKNV